jgi:hypothetical protein
VLEQICRRRGSNPLALWLRRTFPLCGALSLLRRGALALLFQFRGTLPFSFCRALALLLGAFLLLPGACLFRGALSLAQGGALLLGGLAVPLGSAVAPQRAVRFD